MAIFTNSEKRFIKAKKMLTGENYSPIIYHKFNKQLKTSEQVTCLN